MQGTFNKAVNAYDFMKNPRESKAPEAMKWIFKSASKIKKAKDDY